MQFPMESLIQLAYFGCVLVLFLFQVGQLLRERYQLTKISSVPHGLRHMYTPERFEKKRRELLDVNVYNLIVCIKSILMLLLYAKMYSLVWSYAGRHMLNHEFGIDNEVLRSVVAMLLFNTCKMFISIVGAICSVIMERRHGSTAATSVLSLISVTLKRYIRKQIFLMPMIAVHIYAFRRIGALSLLVMWALSAAVKLVVRGHLDAEPQHKFRPFGDEKLRKVLKSFAYRVDFPVKDISVVSRKMSDCKGIVHLSPLFNSQRIVLSPTLLPEANRFTPDETTALLGIELAHWKLNHHLKVLLLTELKPLIRAVAVSSLLHYAPIYSAFGFNNDQPAYMGIQLIQKLVCLPLLSTHRLCKRLLIRHTMFTADTFSACHGYGAALQTALVKLDVSGDRWSDHQEKKNHSPPLLERLAAIAEAMKKMS